ncbi:MAG: nucleotidyltransferase family protein [Planctomycetes bacterium]|nr:nucleotidyltransferase family protein [Planctomycetota bacterium]
MDAVILAAGLGTRLRPHTLTTPKPLLLVQGRPILDWIIGALPKSVDRLFVVTHYLREQVAAYLTSQQRITNATEAFQESPKGTGHALQCCLPMLKSDHVLVLNGDDLFGAKDIAALARGGPGILCHPVDEPEKFGIIFERPDGTIEKLVEKPRILGTHLANTGAYLFPLEVLRQPLALSPRGEYEITDFVNMAISKGSVRAVRASFWHPIGTQEAWDMAQGLSLAICEN